MYLSLRYLPFPKKEKTKSTQYNNKVKTAHLSSTRKQYHHSMSSSSQQFRVSREMRRLPRGVRSPAAHNKFRVRGAHPKSLSENKIRLLPTTADKYYEDDDGHEASYSGWNKLIKTLWEGTRSPKSPFSLLRNHEQTLVRNIYYNVSNEWAKHVKLTLPAPLVGSSAYDQSSMRFSQGRDYPGCNRREYHVDGIPAGMKSRGFEDGFVAFSKCGGVDFPPPEGRNVNMMPFVLGDKDSLPENLQCYHPLIEACPYVVEEIGKVAYLTVHESFVEGGNAQRRQGLHIESPGFVSDDPNAASFTPGPEHSWGMGIFFGPDHYEGGIYFASNVSDTSEVWDALVDRNVPGIVDRHGGCDHLRGIIGEGTKLKAGELVWMTDCTPHEALTQTKSGYRQFFRVVMPYISHWYAEHNTPNPNVTLPDNVTVVEGNKFAVLSGQKRPNKSTEDSVEKTKSGGG